MITPKGRYFGIFNLMLITIFLTADQAALFPNYLLVENEFGVSHTEIGLISSVFTIVAALATLIWAYLVDKYSRKKLILIGVILGEIPCFLTGFVNDYTQLFVIRVLTGFGIGVILPAASSLLGDYFPSQERGKGFGWFLSAMGFGYLLGAAIAGGIGSKFGWRYPFIIIAVPNFFLAPLFYLFVREPRRGETDVQIKNSKGKDIVYNYPVKLSDFKKAVTIKTNLFLNLQSILGCIPWGMLSSWIITFFVYVRGFSIPIATTFALTFTGIRMFGNIWGGYIGDYLSRKKCVYRIILSITTILLAIPFITASISREISPHSDPSQFIIFFILGFVGISLASVAGPNSRAMFLDVNVPENRGMMLSFANLTDVMGTGIGPFFGGLLADRYGLFFALVTSILFWIPCALLWLPLIKALPVDMNDLSKIMKKRASEILKKKKNK